MNRWHVFYIQTHVAVEIRPPVVAAVKAKANVNEYESVHDILSSIVSEILNFQKRSELF